MFLLALRNLRARPGRTLLTALAIALGVAMIFAMRIAAVAITAGSARYVRQCAARSAPVTLPVHVSMMSGRAGSSR